MSIKGVFASVSCVICGIVLSIFLDKITDRREREYKFSQQQMQEQVSEMLQHIINRAGEYGVIFPEYPFVDSFQCVSGYGMVKNSEENTDIKYVVDILRSLRPYNGYYGRWEWSKDWEWIEWRYVVRLSPSVFMYIETYRDSPKHFLRASQVKICEYSDVRCVNDIANNFIEQEKD